MRSRQDVCADTLEAVGMILLWLRYRKSDRMRPIGGGPVLDLAKQILGLQLQPANKEAYRAWRLQRGVEDRLRYAGIDPKNGQLVNLDRWTLAVDRAIGEIADRRNRKKLYKARRATAILEARKRAAYTAELNDFGRFQTYEQRVMVNGTGLDDALDSESSRAVNRVGTGGWQL